MYTGAPEKCLEVLQKTLSNSRPEQFKYTPAKKQTKERKN